MNAEKEWAGYASRLPGDDLAVAIVALYLGKAGFLRNLPTQQVRPSRITHCKSLFSNTLQIITSNQPELVQRQKSTSPTELFRNSRRRNGGTVQKGSLAEAN